MSRAAVALANTSERAAGARGDRRSIDDDLERQLAGLGRGVGPRRSLRPGRTHLFALVLAIVAIWVVAVFARALTDLDRATEQHQAVAAESSALELRLDADRRELGLVQTDAFQGLQARAYGLGGPGEQVFSLAAGAPAPAPIVPLGQSAAGALPVSPLDAWLELLFGS